MLQQVLVILTIVVPALISDLGTRHFLLVDSTKIHMMRLVGPHYFTLVFFATLTLFRDMHCFLWLNFN